MTRNIAAEIQKDISENEIVLYMKGTPDMPMCGFSGTVVAILKNLQVPFKGIDILQDPELREGIKAFTQWPTLPQVYVKGEFIGGCDIVRDMFQSGELAQLLKEKGILA